MEKVQKDYQKNAWSMEEFREQISHVMQQDHWTFQSRYRRILKRKRQKKSWEKGYEQLLKEVELSSQLRQKRLENRPEISYPPNLPITEYRETIIDAIHQHQVLIIAGETGSGKTTQIPKMCLEAGRGIAAKIGCTQPRRIAATSVARQISKELSTDLGNAVGYKIRFSEQASEKTYVQMMTDGILLSEMQHDRFLNGYDTIMIDEAHERSLNIDFLLGYCKRLLKKRSDLKLIISSANLDIPRFTSAFDNAPLIEVSGRMYPVEEFFRPLDEELEEAGELTMNDAVVNTVREIMETTWQGNLLIFMPGEQEIREVIGRLENSKQDVEILPLYGRLSNQEQNRIFQKSSQRKVIVATNIAETSLTIPGIRYVIDTGLARISRYSHRSHTQRLPVELISQSSANQRKGRAGRVQSGVCIRLYSEESFKKRREFTEPEILRSSLAGVILQMKVLRLGEIDEFPFIDPPSAAAIRGSLKLLKELGALDDENQLTSVGREMARLPVEPRTARMLLEGRQQNCLRELLVIAAGISIQDPREYPLEKETHARQMHSVFVDRNSDFLTLLNLWNKYHEEWDSRRSENKMRKFCKRHFLSFVRMREWRDIYQQLKTILSELPDFQLNEIPADYQEIHTSILAGYLDQIGLKKQKNLYQTAGDKEMMIFPGSMVYQRGKTWIVAAELVETSRLFARKVANIEEEWLEAIGRNLCRRTYSEAYFDKKSGSVMAYEKVTLHGLVIVPKRRVLYGKINPAEATAVFIREGLVEGKLRTHHPFFQHNHALKAQVIENGAKIRRNYEFEVEAAMEDFYAQQLYNICSIHDLNGLIKQKKKENESRFLFMSEDDLTPDHFDSASVEEFPDHWTVGNQHLELEYQFVPDKEKDGATLRVQENMLPYLDANTLEWLIPGQRKERIYYLLKSLPKKLRKQLVPLSQTAQEIADCLKPSSQKFVDTLAVHLRQTYGIHTVPDDWKPESLPEYLKIRLEIYDDQEQLITSGRDIESLLQERQGEFDTKQQTKKLIQELPQWQAAVKKWEIKNLTGWTFEALPPQIEIAAPHGIPLYAYPGLTVDADGIHRCLFLQRQEARRETKKGMIQLLGLNMGTEIAWLERDLRELRELEHLYSPFGTISQLKKHAKINLYDYLFDTPWVENRTEFEKVLTEAQQKIKGLWLRFKKQLQLLLEQYTETKNALYKQLADPLFFEQYEELSADLSRLLPSDFVKTISYAKWQHVIRYLKAMSIRAERLALNVMKDQEKAEALTHYLKTCQFLKQQTNLTEEQQVYLDEFYWMLEEFKVSLFAPELRTAMPISKKRLDKHLEKVNQGLIQMEQS